ncbi:hypothetical protein ES702_01206 [subsurface metagenome]
MFWHRTGYKPNLEAVATHSRKRYRLIPNNQMAMGNPDPCLWLIHYSKAQARDQHPAASLPIPPVIAQSFQQRAAIQRSGQIPRKEFMLHDRTSWPVINLPTAIGRAGSAGQVVAGHRRGASLQEHQATLEEEEDVSRGDALDFMTPREISRMRYEQHHEWMEEILESHYASKNIIPSDLGLGRKGPLESLTNGFFTAPVSVAHEPINGSVGKLPPGKSDEFAKHAEQKLAEMQAELDKMKQDHARRMEKLKRTTALGAAERKLRNMNPSDDSYKTIGAQVQDMVGREIKNVQHLSLVSKGGMQEIKPLVQPSSFTQNAVQNTVQAQPNQNQQQRPAQQQQQQTSPQQQQSQQAPRQVPSQQQVPQNQQPQQPQVSNPQPTGQMQQSQPPQQPQPVVAQQKSPQELGQSNLPGQTSPTAQTGQMQDSAQPQSMPEASDTPVENNDAVSLDNDLDMDDPGDQDLQIGDDNNDGADWDMLVDQSGDNEQGTEEQSNSNNDQNSGSRPASTTNQAQNPSNNNTPGVDTNDFDMVTDFDHNMDTAGDALADYGGGDDDLNLEESAFGDAFHSHEQDMA